MNNRTRICGKYDTFFLTMLNSKVMQITIVFIMSLLFQYVEYCLTIAIDSSISLKTVSPSRLLDFLYYRYFSYSDSREIDLLIFSSEIEKIVSNGFIESYSVNDDGCIDIDDIPIHIVNYLKLKELNQKVYHDENTFILEENLIN